MWFCAFVAGENLGHLGPLCYFKFQLHEFALRDSVGVWDMEHRQGLTGAGEEYRSILLPRGEWRVEKRGECTEGRWGGWGDELHTLTEGNAVLTFQMQNSWFSLNTVTFTQPDQAKESVLGIRGSRVMKGQFLLITCNFSVGEFSALFPPLLIHF